MKALKTRRFTLVTVVLAVALAVTFLVSFVLGRYPIPLRETVAILWDAILEGVERLLDWICGLFKAQGPDLGEAGKGFAVVADQVKKLAEESAAAAGRTNVLIETTIATVEKGIAIADGTVEKMNEVVVNSQAATDKMMQISEKLRNDVNNMHDINASIADVSSVVDNNSATSEETAAVSEEQKAQVDTMVSIMESFSI